jgi:diacylglycerol kinase (ATP)
MDSLKNPKLFFNKGFIGSVNVALEGVVHALQRERNMRIHFIAGFLVIIAGIYMNFDSTQLVLLFFAVTFVLVAEMFNTAIEHAIDLVNDEYHPLAKISKDIAAGAVFVSAVNALITAYLLFVRPITWKGNGVFIRIAQSPWHITLIALLAVTGLVLLIKILRKEAFLLKGGMPSGHSAVAFSVWVAVSMVTSDVLVSVLVFLLAVLVARGRLSNGIHNLWEVLAGGALGTLVTLLVFQVLS